MDAPVPQGRRVTLADVAARAGVSTTAASLVLNDRPGSRLSEEAAQRIRAAARELRYRPNQAARTLRLGRTRTIGFISDDVILTRYASAMVRGALDLAEQREHTVLIAETGTSATRRTDAVAAMLDHRADGLIFASMGAKLVDLPPLPEHVRAVLLNGASPGPHPSVLPAELEAGQRIARVLLDQGHRRIALLGDPPPQLLEPRTSVTIGSRLAGITAAFAAAGVEPVLRLPHAEWEPHHGYAMTQEVLRSDAGVTALLCLNDRLAFGAYQALQEAGLRVPDDLSVASFDDDEVAGYLRPGLTTARIPYEEMGRRAVEMLLGSAPAESALVDMPLQLRDSVAPAR